MNNSPPLTFFPTCDTPQIEKRNVQLSVPGKDGGANLSKSVIYAELFKYIPHKDEWIKI